MGWAEKTIDEAFEALKDDLELEYEIYLHGQKGDILFQFGMEDTRQERRKMLAAKTGEETKDGKILCVIRFEQELQSMQEHEKRNFKDLLKCKIMQEIEKI